MSTLAVLVVIKKIDVKLSIKEGSRNFYTTV